MAGNYLQALPLEPPASDQNMLAPQPTMADAYDYNSSALANWIAQQRAQSVAMGLLDPQTGLPTKRGVIDAGRKMADAMLMGSIAPEAKGASIMDNPSFVQWFGNSKIVAANGSPLTVYHGTNADVQAFSPDTAGSKTGNVTTPLGHFFTDNPQEASRYASQWADAGGNVMPVHLSLQNPYEMSHRDFDNIAMSVVRGEKTQDQAMADSADLRSKLMQQGYDGIIIPGSKNGLRPTEYVAFHPTQIKSAIGNQGTFDPNNPNIAYGAAVMPASTDDQNQ